MTRLLFPFPVSLQASLNTCVPRYRRQSRFTMLLRPTIWKKFRYLRPTYFTYKVYNHFLFRLYCRPPWILVYRDLDVKAEKVSLGDVRRLSGPGWRWHELPFRCWWGHSMAGRTCRPHFCFLRSNRTGVYLFYFSFFDHEQRFGLEGSVYSEGTNAFDISPNR